MNTEVLNELLEIHKRVLFTDISLGLKDAPVCQTCHWVLDVPEDWTEDQSEQWDFPNVQQDFPCRTRQLVISLMEHP